MSEKIKKKGKEFWEALKTCETAENVFDLLGETVEPDVVAEYEGKNKMPEIVRFNAHVAKISKSDLSDEAYLEMGALRYMQITKKDIKVKEDMKEFYEQCKKSAQKFADQKEKDKNNKLLMMTRMRGYYNNQH